jgi:RNA polymerase sigma factor (sigma-70 family)
LARFVNSRDPDAFEKLVRRHGSLVMGICRRILGADADDAFQATFFVLARKAAKIRKRESVASWLHGVAYSISRSLQTKLARQRRRETSLRPNVEPITMSPDLTQQSSLRELGVILDEEINRLPANCRIALIACHFEGQSAAAAAQQLGVPTSTLKARLARGRDLLRQRLARRGIGISSVALSIFLGEQGPIHAASALVDATVKASLGFAVAGTASVSTQVTALATNALQTMAFTKALTGILVVAMIGIMAVLGAATAIPQATEPKPPILDAEAIIPADSGRPGSDQPGLDQPGDRLPNGAIARLGTAHWRHDRRVGFAAFHPDGKSVVTVGDDMTIRVWDYPSGRERRRIDLAPASYRQLPGFGMNYFAAAALTRDGRVIATSMHRPQIRLHDLASGAERLVELKSEVEREVRSLAFSADGQRLAAIDDQGRITIWNWAEGKALKTFAGPAVKSKIGYYYRDLTLSPDGKIVAAIDCIELEGAKGRRNSLRIWNTETGTEIATVHDAQEARGYSQAFSPDSARLAFLSARNMVNIVDTATGKLIRTIRTGPPGGKTALIFNGDGTSLFQRMEHDQALMEWDVASGQLLRSLGSPLKSSFQEIGSIDSLSLSPDGKVLVLAGVENCPIFIDVASGQRLAPDAGHSRAIVNVRFTVDGKQLLTQDLAPAIRRWDALTGSSLGKVDLVGDGFQAAISSDGKIVALRTIEHCRDKPLFLDAVTSKEIGRAEPTITGIYVPMVFSGDGRVLALQSQDEPKIDLLEVPTGKRRMTLAVPTADSGKAPWNRDLQNLAASPSGRLLALTDSSKVVLWDIATGQQSGVIALPRPAQRDGPPAPEDFPLQSGAFSPDDRRFALDFEDGVVIEYDLATCQPQRVYGEKLPPVHRELKNFGAFSSRNNEPQYLPRLVYAPDGKSLALAGRDQLVHVWDVATGIELAAYNGHAAPLTAVAFAPNSRMLASASWDTTTLLWDLSKLPRPALANGASR